VCTGVHRKLKYFKVDYHPRGIRQSYTIKAKILIKNKVK